MLKTPYEKLSSACSSCSVPELCHEKTMRGRKINIFRTVASSIVSRFRIALLKVSVHYCFSPICSVCSHGSILILFTLSDMVSDFFSKFAVKTITLAVTKLTVYLTCLYAFFQKIVLLSLACWVKFLFSFCFNGCKNTNFRF
jgi:hypothetical protein